MSSHSQSQPRFAEPQAQRRAESTMARNGALVRYPQDDHDPAS